MNHSACRSQALADPVVKPPDEVVTEPKQVPPIYQPERKPPILDPRQEPEGPTDESVDSPLQKQRALAGLKPGQLDPNTSRFFKREQELLERRMVMKNFWYAAGRKSAVISPIFCSKYICNKSTLGINHDNLQESIFLIHRQSEFLQTRSSFQFPS